MFNEHNDILNVEDVMELLCVGKNTAYELLRKDEIKCFRIKSKWKIPKQSVIDYINQKSGKTT